MNDILEIEEQQKIYLACNEYWSPRQQRIITKGAHVDVSAHLLFLQSYGGHSVVKTQYGVTCITLDQICCSDVKVLTILRLFENLRV